MKIVADKFREDLNIEKWISFRTPEYKAVSLVFLRRLAALARDFNHSISNLIGYRSLELQKALYEQDLQRNGGVPSGKVSRPGNSWHEYSLAVDLGEGYWNIISNFFWMPYGRLDQGLNQYGLSLPLNKVDSKVLEWWHLQPIETIGYTGDRSKFLAPDDAIYTRPHTIKKGDKDIWVTELCRLLGLKPQYDFTDSIQKAVLNVQTIAKLVPDGIVGPKTWTVLYAKAGG
ncbi:MAG: M15 family metallopeptidase [Clostridia bacterium]|nr:M15 family metallopeptidase [Clostridia bacterium]